MRRFAWCLAVAILCACGSEAFAAKGKSMSGSHSVKSHTTKSGKYVAPTRAKNPNKTQRDNYSTKGNVNPYSGKAGTKIPKK